MKWSEKRVLVTGGSGFIPSHLVRRLVGAGAEVLVTVKYNSIVDNVRVVDLWNDITVLEADLRNHDSLKYVAEAKPDIVFHMAAYNHVGDSFKHVSEAMDSNAKGTVNLLEALDGYEKLVYISTSEVYGYQTSVPFTESMTPFPISPYSIGKYSGELYAHMMHHVHAQPVAVVRPFNAFGPYQSSRAVIAELIIKCLQGIPVLTTEGKQTREFNYVSNLVDGIMMAAASSDATGQTINIGAGEETAIRDLAQNIHTLCESSSDLQLGALPDRPTEIWRMRADATRAQDILNWKPEVSLEEGLRRTIAWFRRYLDEFENDQSGISKLARTTAD